MTYLMTESVYIESSIVSYLTSRPSRDVVISARQVITENWWLNQRSNFDLFVSALVIQEIFKGDQDTAERRLNAVADIPLLGASQDALLLSEALLIREAVPKTSEEDALHISIAAASGIDFLLTWNFRHINNAHTKAAISAVIEAYGFVSLVLCSPEELGAEL
ncbi:type II toxin-antitoxin system VapC family toxin [Thioalkalicoccus limnaeus]|uniref:Type II toxin-antitoxin system VapC family toxin n=1 Tax=Thioalkalicoccus limnaeus TaxID=120681 RepID=A0ABV4BJN4_9GAMM